MSLLCELWRRFIASSNFLYQQNTSAEELLMRTPSPSSLSIAVTTFECYKFHITQEETSDKTLNSGIKIFKYFQISRQNMMERVEYLRKPIQSQIVSPVHRHFLLIFYSSKTFLEVPLQIANCHSFHQIIFYYLFSFTFYLLTTAFSCYSPST